MNDLAKPPTDSARFRKMADAIDHNATTSKFGGAAVIAPPGGAGQPLELLILDAQADPAQFWSTLQTRIQFILQELNERQRTGFGR